jgi:hypothetical protein
VSLTVHRVGSTLLVDDAAPVAAAVSHAQRKFGHGRPGVLEHNANLDIPHGNHLAAPPAPAALGAWQQQQLLEAKLLYHAFHADVTTHSAGEPTPLRVCFRLGHMLAAGALVTQRPSPPYETRSSTVAD